MNKKHCYAVKLKGKNPSVVDSLHQFDTESIREDWLADYREQGYLCVKVNSTLAKRLNKTHFMRHTELRENKGWTTNLTLSALSWVEYIVRGE